MNTILSWSNKYGTYYYDASTVELLDASARLILKELLKDGWWPAPSEPSVTKEEAEAVAMDEAVLAALPPALRDQLIKLRKSVARRRADFEAEVDEFTEAKAIAAGEKIFQLYTSSDKYNGDWDDFVARFTKRWPNSEVREDGVYRSITAWDILQNRGGYEYEDYSLVDVINPLESRS